VLPITLQILCVIRTHERCSGYSNFGTVTSELMFEQYSVPSLTYCIDSVMSFYHNNRPDPSNTFTSDGLVISFNTASTSVVPILNGKGILSHAKRLAVSSILQLDMFNDRCSLSEYRGEVRNRLNTFSS
jgi:hypothetical protein